MLVPGKIMDLEAREELKVATQPDVPEFALGRLPFSTSPALDASCIWHWASWATSHLIFTTL